MPILKSKDKNNNRSVNFAHVDGLHGYLPNDAINVTINMQEKNIVFLARVFKRPEIRLPLAKLTDVVFTSEKEIIEKNKSVIGRAAVGTLLAGPLGAMVGGMSGIGNKQKGTTNNYIFITYVSGDEEKTIVLHIVGASIGWAKFLKELKTLCPLSPSEDKITL